MQNHELDQIHNRDESLETARMAALRDLNLVDSSRSEAFDRITRMASQLFNLPIAAVSLTDHDRQWFKSRVGTEDTQSPREKAPCAQVTATHGVVVLSDMASHPFYEDSTLAKAGIRFYAGAPLVTRDGFALGAMCVLGKEPRNTTDHEIKVLKDLAAMVMAQIEMEHAFGRVDPLTGLPNRNQFIEDMDDMARDRAGKRHVLVLIDLVEAAQMAQTMRVVGTAYIENLVKASMRLVRDALGAKIKLYQISTTQYVYVLGDMNDGAIAGATAAMHQVLDAVIQSDGIPLTLDAALGVTPFRLGEIAPRDLLRTAHGAAQDARETESGVGHHSPARDDVHRRRFTLLGDIRGALTAADQLSLHFQPRIDLRSGQCVGAEALLRWKHPHLGNIPPGEFIPLVEQTALGRDLTEWVFNAALAQLAQWRASGIELVLSVNIAAPNLDEADFTDRLVAKLKHHCVPPSAIELELTEGVLIRNGRKAIDALKAISAAGVTLAIDDFGTGYSSLSYLQQIPASVIKIDRSFMMAIEAEPRTRRLVRAMIALAHDLGYRVVAEGVETQEVSDVITAQECDELQGYLISRPLPAAAFEGWLASYVPQAAPASAVQFGKPTKEPPKIKRTALKRAA